MNTPCDRRLRLGHHGRWVESYQSQTEIGYLSACL
nr:hypothetical protein GPVRGNEL_GPVRGNEL_CDS_0017 [Caudoviricetes sp.]